MGRRDTPLPMALAPSWGWQSVMHLRPSINSWAVSSLLRSPNTAKPPFFFSECERFMAGEFHSFLRLSGVFRKFLSLAISGKKRGGGVVILVQLEIQNKYS